MDLLEMPIQFACLQRQRNDGVCKQIHAEAFWWIAPGIANRDIEHSKLRIDGERFPHSTAVSLAANPRRAGDLPALIFCILRNRVEMPETSSRLRIDGHDVSPADMTFTPCGSHVDNAVVNLWGSSKPIARRNCRLRVGIPRLDDVQDHTRLSVAAESGNELPGFRVEREEKGSRSRVNLAVGKGDTAIAKNVAFFFSAPDQVRRVECPQEVAFRSIQRIHAAARIGDIHHAINDDWSRLVAHAVNDPGLEEPSRCEGLDV